MFIKTRVLVAMSAAPSAVYDKMNTNFFLDLYDSHNILRKNKMVLMYLLFVLDKVFKEVARNAYLLSNDEQC